MNLSGFAVNRLTWPGQQLSPVARAVLAAFTALIMLSCRSSSDTTAYRPFPQSNQIPGWSVAGEMRTFQADNLWEYIDGDADRYLQAGVDRTLALSYLYQGKTEAQADIYIMKSPDGARKILDAEPSEGSRRIELGEEARLSPGSLVFRKGRYLVRLTAFQESPEVGEALMQLGRGIEKQLEAQ